MFTTLVFHEIRPQEELALGMRPIQVADGYQDQLPLPLYNDLADFTQQLHYLKDEGYHFLTLAAVKAFYRGEKTLPKKAVLLTFDDCYQSQLKYAYPLLKELDIPAVMFVPTGWVFTEKVSYQENYSRVVSFAELKEMSDVFTYANHTDHFHQRQGREKSRLMWENTPDVTADLKACNHYELITAKDVFAYPFGLYDESNVQLLKSLGFQLAFTTLTGMNTATTNPLELKRNVVPAGLTLAQFKKILGVA